MSPTLFILTAEVLSRALNSLFEDGMYKGYGLHKWSRYLNHLAYADDTIIFTSADKPSLDLMMKELTDYQQMAINK